MKKFIGITMGCPVGIGPEIILKFFTFHSSESPYQPVVLGDVNVLRRTADQIGLQASFEEWTPGSVSESSVIPVYNLSDLSPDELSWGHPTIATGKAMARYIEEGARMALDGELEAIVTCPITKSALKAAGYSYPGHTEMLGNLTKTSDFGMMMAGNKLKTVLVTIHEPLSKVPGLLTRQKIVDTITMTVNSLVRDFGIQKPRVAVAGLNPHGGEDGMFGEEEFEIIGPGVVQCSDLGEIVGPLPPDTVFFKAVNGGYDAVVAMYHDQGLIPFKLIHFKDGVNVTLGLPIVRTSVDHGTAYDIAGKGVADYASLAAAWDLAGVIAFNRMNGKCNER
ncbi:MAG: 4-hydroxythreonine-4-phosphate dehydrogenase PdxA [Desulfobulbaceae bacterium]|nr:4-hydroxythreonine-4-phosphate dehydrogenase PdxA [Desulfobulbaceae bacterium]